jgi:glycosyltransferase involved in cell wall biosynthesis
VAGLNGLNVLHVLPVDLARGAQTYARSLRVALDGHGAHHRTLVLFGPSGTTLQPDITLGIADGWLRRAGLDPRAVWRLRAVVRRDAPDVVVAHGGEPLKYARWAGVPSERLVYYKIGVGGSRLHGGKRGLHARYLARARMVAAVSSDAADEAGALGVRDDRLVVIPNGRDPSAYQWPRPERQAARPRVVFVGHLTESKQPGRFVDVVRALRRDGVDVDAAIAGDGPLLESLRQPAATDRVELLGRVDDVPALLGASDVFVFTSVAEGEGMPGVLIEAALAGLPAVTTDVPGAGDVVIDGQTGFVVALDDVGALVRATRELVDDAARRAAFGAAARAHGVANFAIDASFERWNELFAAVFGRSCASST